MLLKLASGEGIGRQLNSHKETHNNNQSSECNEPSESSMSTLRASSTTAIAHRGAKRRPVPKAVQCSTTLTTKVWVEIRARDRGLPEPSLNSSPPHLLRCRLSLLLLALSHTCLYRPSPLDEQGGLFAHCERQCDGLRVGLEASALFLRRRPEELHGEGTADRDYVQRPASCQTPQLVDMRCHVEAWTLDKRHS